MNDRPSLNVLAAVLGMASLNNISGGIFGPTRPRLFHPSVPSKKVNHRRLKNKMAKASRKRNRAA